MEANCVLNDVDVHFDDSAPWFVGSDFRLFYLDVEERPQTQAEAIH
jgi:hypothetical protein